MQQMHPSQEVIFDCHGNGRIGLVGILDGWHSGWLPFWMGMGWEFGLVGILDSVFW